MESAIEFEPENKNRLRQICGHMVAVVAVAVAVGVVLWVIQKAVLCIIEGVSVLGAIHVRITVIHDLYYG